MTVFTMYQNAEFYATGAERFLSETNFTDAILYYRKAIELDSTNEKYYVRLSNIYSALGEFGESISLLATVKDSMEIQSKSGHSSGKFNRELHSLSLSLTDSLTKRLGDYLPARNGNNNYYEIISSIKENAEESLENGMSDLEEEEADKLLSFRKIFTGIDKLEYIDTKHIRNSKRFERAKQAFMQSDFDKAILVAQTVEEDTMYYPPSRSLIIHAAMESGDLDLATTVAHDFYEKQPLNPLAYEGLLELYVTALDVSDEEVLSFVNNIIVSLAEHNRYESLRSLGVLLSLLDFNDAAVKATAEDFYANKASSVRNICHIGTLINAGDYANAKRRLNKAIRLFPTNGQILFMNWLLRSKSLLNSPSLINNKVFTNIILENSVDEISRQYFDEFSNNCINYLNDECILTPKALDLMDVIFTSNFRKAQNLVLALNYNNKSNAYIDFLIDKLRYPFIPKDLKSSMIEAILNTGKNLDKNVTVTYLDGFRIIKLYNVMFPNTPYGKLMREVYATTYSKTIEVDFWVDAKLLHNIAYEVAKRELKLSSQPAFSGALFFYAVISSSGKVPEVDMLSTIAKSFKTKTPTLIKYIREIKPVVLTIKGFEDLISSDF